MDLSIVIVNWNTREMLRDCLTLVEDSCHGLTTEINVVDNGSTDGSAEMLRADFPSINLIENPRNLGFAMATNQGILESSGDYVALVNSDTMLTPGALTEMTRYLHHHNDVGAVGCQLFWQSGRQQYSGGVAPSLSSAFNQMTLLTNMTGGRVRGLFMNSRRDGRVQDVDWVCAACMVVRKSVFDEVGMLNENHFMYAEDLELGMRLRAAGWRIQLLPWVKVLHYGGASSAENGYSMQTAWLEGLYLLTSEKLNRPRFTAFGVLMSLAFTYRAVGFLLARVASGITGGDRDSYDKRWKVQRKYLGVSLKWAVKGLNGHKP